jgi:hypothetical protein
MTEVSVTGQQSFSSVSFAFLGIETMVDILKKLGITDWYLD